MHRRKGITTLTALLVIASILLSGGIALHTSLRNTLVATSEASQAQSIRSLALSCIYEGWYQLAQDQSYSGESLVLDTGMCTISVTNQSNEYIITSEAQIENFFTTYELTLDEQQNTLTPIMFIHSD